MSGFVFIDVVCSGCGRDFKIYESDYYTRKKRSKSGKLFCNKACKGKSLKAKQ